MCVCPGIEDYKPLTEIKTKLAASMQAMESLNAADAEELNNKVKKAIEAVRLCGLASVDMQSTVVMCVVAVWARPMLDEPLWRSMPCCLTSDSSRSVC